MKNNENRHSELDSESSLHKQKNFSYNKIIFIILFTATSVSINYFCGKVVYVFSIPIYLDSVMTISVVALCGLTPGIACAFFSNLFLYDKKSIMFSICHILTALGAYFVFRNPKFFKDENDFFDSNLEKASYKELTFELFLWAGFFSAITNTITGNVISTILFGKGDYRSFSSLAKSIFTAVPNVTFANLFTGFVENIADKFLSAIISYVFYKILAKLACELKCGKD